MVDFYSEEEMNLMSADNVFETSSTGNQHSDLQDHHTCAVHFNILCFKDKHTKPGQAEDVFADIVSKHGKAPYVFKKFKQLEWWIFTVILRGFITVGKAMSLILTGVQGETIPMSVMNSNK
ncbi:hypothetical protein EB796_016307 [Bugula neritina]|uniref:Uncharacterized protein n=1 Tax=Bugula neritina TaxID=10212 RepID=A0A7J7JGK6_BUGNE|nr:hypothetical protein EB796_016307 [Bugula neritina]